MYMDHINGKVDPLIRTILRPVTADDEGPVKREPKKLTGSRKSVTTENDDESATKTD